MSADAKIVGSAAVVALLRRDVLRFVRQPSRIVAAIGTSVMLWVVLGSGFAGSFAPAMAVDSASEGETYRAYLIPGVAVAVVVFSSVFGAIGLIDDRRDGFLQAQLVSPTPMWATIGARVVSSSALAWVQALPVLLAALVIGVPGGAAGLVGAAAGMLLIAVGMSGLSLAAAWRINSVQGFHGVMNLVLMPMWLLSGAFFPVEGASPWLRTVMMVNPLTWGTECVRSSLRGAESGQGAGWMWMGAAGFAAATLALCAGVMKRP
ncbi:MAG: ABC transporter permease [Phycisphaeraceae bacterium]|nr:ABC transporter permease [Phycisphaeraceae bacterium]